MPKQRTLGLVAKGMCMGIADIIPGVSGGTMALMLGIYREFIDGVKSLNPRPIFAFVRWVASGFDATKRDELRVAVETVHWRFLIPLTSGIAVAMGIGSLIIPTLLEQHPEIMRGLFFGLILASIAVPLAMIPRNGRARAAAALAAILAGAFGYVVTDPDRLLDSTSEWVQVQVGSDERPSLKDVLRRGPSSLDAADVYWSPANDALRQAHATEAPDAARDLADHRAAALGVVATDKTAHKRRAAPYEAIEVPPGTIVSVPRPSYLFVLLAGAVAISAMVLPGISGSFILLVLGCYYFILNAVKGTLAQLAHFELPGQSLLYVVLFLTGLVAGLTSFSRVLSFLLHRFPAATMGALVGLMIGCLRGIWPFRAAGVAGSQANVWPEAWGALELHAVLAGLAGIAVVVLIDLAGRRLARAT